MQLQIVHDMLKKASEGLRLVLVPTFFLFSWERGEDVFFTPRIFASQVIFKVSESYKVQHLNFHTFEQNFR